MPDFYEVVLQKPFLAKNPVITSKAPVAFSCKISLCESLRYSKEGLTRLTEKLIPCPEPGCMYISKSFDAGNFVKAAGSNTPGQKPVQNTKSYSPSMIYMRPKSVWFHRLRWRRQVAYHYRASKVGRVEVCEPNCDRLHQSKWLLICLGVFHDFRVIEWRVEKPSQKINCPYAYT